MPTLPVVPLDRIKDCGSCLLSSAKVGSVYEFFIAWPLTHQIRWEPSSLCYRGSRTGWPLEPEPVYPMWSTRNVRRPTKIDMGGNHMKAQVAHTRSSHRKTSWGRQDAQTLVKPSLKLLVASASPRPLGTDGRIPMVAPKPMI